MFKEHTILIVEDDLEFANVLKDILSDDFKEVYLTSNATDGMELFKNFHPSIILSDVNMPKVGGLEFLRDVKKDNPNQPFLLMSGYNYYLKNNKIDEEDYIQKPLIINELYKKLQTLLKK